MEWTKRELEIKTSAMATSKYAPHSAMLVEQYQRVKTLFCVLHHV